MGLNLLKSKSIDNVRNIIKNLDVRKKFFATIKYNLPDILRNILENNPIIDNYHLNELNLDNKLKNNISITDLNNALQDAVSANNLEITKILIEYKADPEQFNILFAASAYGYMEVITYITPFITNQVYLQHFLWSAVKNNQEEVIKYYISLGVSPTKETILYAIKNSSSVIILEQLLNNNEFDLNIFYLDILNKYNPRFLSLYLSYCKNKLNPLYLRYSIKMVRKFKVFKSNYWQLLKLYLFYSNTKYKLSTDEYDMLMSNCITNNFYNLTKHIIKKRKNINTINIKYVATYSDLKILKFFYKHNKKQFKNVTLNAMLIANKLENYIFLKSKNVKFINEDKILKILNI